MKLNIIDKTGKKVADYELNVTEYVREDIFKKAVIAEDSIFRTSNGSSPEAGRRHSINVSKRRQVFKSTYGKGGSRTPKKVMWRRGMQLRYVGAFAPQTVGGRRAHPPKAEKIVLKNMNNKEWIKALRIGFTASMDNAIVAANGQRVPKAYPVILDDSVEAIEKTSEFKSVLAAAGFSDEMERASIRKVRAGKGTMRGRTYKDKRGPLVIVSSFETPLLKAARNIKGFDVATPELLMVSDFGMSIAPGRAVIFTKAAMEEFKEVLM